MLQLSRKVKISILRNLNSLIDKTYNESTIKELLIDLREIGNEIKNGAKKSDQGIEKLDQIIIDFIDICNCIAHTNRLRGTLEKNIRNYIEHIQDTLNKSGTLNLSDHIVSKSVISADSLVAGMLGTIFLYLLKHEKEFNEKKLMPVFNDRADIGLCIISLLQDTVITLKKQTGVARLHVLSHEGKYRLYCRIYKSSIQREAQERTGGSGRFIVGFPVITTSANDIDKILFNVSSEKSPKIIETYRDRSGSLHVKIVD